MLNLSKPNFYKDEFKQLSQYHKCVKRADLSNCNIMIDITYLNIYLNKNSFKKFLDKDSTCN